jgi:hypothetical protein
MAGTTSIARIASTLLTGSISTHPPLFSALWFRCKSI